jgi:hypothetical protein
MFVDRGDSPPMVESASDTGKVSTVRLVNWHNPLGISYALPRAALVRGTYYDISFFVQTIGEKNGANRLVNYSIVVSR